MSVREMAPSRALDALVAEKVFGFRWERHGRVWINDRETVRETWLPTGSDPRRPPAGTYAGFGPMPYSSEITPAWAVVDALNARGCHVVIEQSTGSSIVHVYPKGTDPEDRPASTVLAPSPALGICLAALHAAGLEEHVRSLCAEPAPEDVDAPIGGRR